MKLSVLMPVFNEAPTIAEVVERVRAGITIHELPIRYTARYENKKLSPADGWPTLRALWKYRRWKPGPFSSPTTSSTAR